MNRRGFLDRAKRVAIGGAALATGGSLLAQEEAPAAESMTVAEAQAFYQQVEQSVAVHGEAMLRDGRALGYIKESLFPYQGGFVPYSWMKLMADRALGR